MKGGKSKKSRKKEIKDIKSRIVDIDPESLKPETLFKSYEFFSFMA
jgi:hypothetical protein